jgi:hypothetical protein
MTITIKKNDTKLLFRQRPTIDGESMSLADLAGCTVSFLMKGSGIAIKAAATISGTGYFEYQPIASDVAKAGTFRQEWELTFPSTKILTFPNGDYNTVNILADLG